ncbi:hypothetical protein [Glutamicibacter ardleyensis]|uniref:TrbL/VirB6 plasmid conjugal transfer protein n=1 Tax=Glutamicibacter ardleyensis TaxID=225894 RepID=A0ABQ2DWJ6_9MICC|nr:hypothetical protein [Glutamicibacter ardleyensis]GGJ73160.1 hypothetical protein GCM10007173_35200 [Glutamicibacter ardleyensis]
MTKLLSVLSSLAVIAFLSTFLLVAAPSPVHADEDTKKVEEALTQDQVKRFEKMPEKEKAQLLDEVLSGIAKEKCGEFEYYTKMESVFSFQKRNCEEQTRDALHHMYPTAQTLILGEGEKMDFCEALKETGASGQGISYCIKQKINAQFKDWSGQKVRGYLEQSELGRSILNVTDAIDNTIEFVADPKSNLDELANSSKSESIAMTSKVLEEISSTTEFDASSPEFKDRWALYAGLGVVGLGLMIMFLFKQHSNGEMSDDDFSKSLLYYLPAALFMVIYGPWVMNELQQRVAPLTDGTSDWAAESISNFITVISRFGSLESTSWFGPLAAILFFGLLFVGALALLVYFLLIPIFQQLMGLAIALLIGMLLSPKTRRYVMKIATTLVTMSLLKTFAFLVLGAVFAVLATQPAFKDGVDDVLVNVGNLGATAAIMLMIVLSPAAIFRWMPVLESREAKFGGISPEISAGVGGAVGGAIGSGAGSVRRAISTRRGSATSRSAQSSGGQGGSSGEGSSPRPSGPSPDGGSTTAVQSPDTGSPQKTNGAHERASQNQAGAPTGAPAAANTSQQGQNPAPPASPDQNGQQGGSPPPARTGGTDPARQGPTEQNSSAPASSGPNAPSSSSRQGRKNPPSGRAKKIASVAATAAFSPLTAGAVGLLAGTKYAATNAAAQARMAANDADPDSWDSFKDR